jgi:hypothetical protein
MEAAGRLWENLHTNQTPIRKKDDEVYKARALPLHTLLHFYP